MDSIDQFLNDGEIDDSADEIYNPLTVVDRDELSTPHSPDNVTENAIGDYEFVRKNLKQIIETNIKAMERLAKVAGESDSPRAFEVMSSYMKQMVEANESLMGLHKDAKELMNQSGGGDDTPSGATSVTNNYYTGSTEDLLTLIEKMEEEGKPIIIDHDPEKE